MVVPKTSRGILLQSSFVHTSIVDSLTLEKTSEALGRVKSKFEIENERLAIITADRYEETYNILRNNFLPDEPLCQTFGIKWHEEFEKVIFDDLKRNLSLCTISKDTDDVMAVLINGVIKKTDPPADFSGMEYEPLRCLFTFLTHKNNEVYSKFFERYQVDEAMYVFMGGIKKPCQNVGIGGLGNAAAIAMGHELGFKAVKGEATNNFTQRIAEKQGWDLLLEMPYHSYFYKGRLLSDSTGEHRATKIYGRKI